jgi:hypothetical protein
MSAKKENAGEPMHAIRALTSQPAVAMSAFTERLRQAFALRGIHTTMARVDLQLEMVITLDRLVEAGAKPDTRR